MLFTRLTASLTRSLIAAICLAAPSLAQGGGQIYVDDDAPLGGDGTSWATAHRYLQDALIPAPADAVIYIAQGSYKPDDSENHGFITRGDRTQPFTIARNVTLFGGYAGIGAPNPDERDIEVYQTILTGDLNGLDPADPGLYSPPAGDPSSNLNVNDNSAHVVRITEDASGILSGLTIERGIAWQDSQAPNWNGGGVIVDTTGSTLFLSECLLRWNYAAQRGGGVSSVGVLIVDRTTFINNRSTEGGAVACFRPAQDEAQLNVTFSRNRFYENYAGPDRGRGGAISYDGFCRALAVNNVFRQNLSQGVSSADGAVFYMYKDIKVEAYNNTFYKNMCLASGEASGSVLSIQGGGGVSGVNLEFANNICWGNVPNTAQMDYNGAGIGNFGHNDIEQLASNLPAGVLSPGDDFEADPLFVGDLWCHIQKTSPCVDRGTNQAIQPAYLPFHSEDNDSSPRVMDVASSGALGSGGDIGWASPPQASLRPIVDVGAFEQFDDCNNNRVPDATDILDGTSSDCDSNGVPDECQPDCDADGVIDPCEADCNADGTPDDCQDLADCDENGTPDICESFNDCNSNGIPDRCEPDCDDDGTPDDCERDCDDDGLPDDCEEDCDEDGVPDDCEEDCDEDGVPDDCEEDCDEDGVPDDCESDCDNDGLPDDCEVDCNSDGTPDDCQDLADCDENGTPDACEPFDDCNANDIPDRCESDCDGDGLPDDCEVDCDEDGIPDDCQTLADCDENGIPDACREVLTDCNGNGVPDGCDIADGTSLDCNNNQIPDECDVTGDVETDCDRNGVPDSCDLDCDENGTPDACDIADGAHTDCNGNEIPDTCDIASGLSQDVDTDGVPDECQPDCNRNGVPDSTDISSRASIDCDSNGIPDECENDCNANGIGDQCEIDSSPREDCNENGILDECELSGRGADLNQNGVLDECECRSSTYCDGASNSVGEGAVLSLNGLPSVSQPGSLRVSQLPQGAPVVYFYGTKPFELPFGAGVRCVSYPVKRLHPAQVAGRDGATELQLDFSAPPLFGEVRGSTLFVQAWYIDSGEERTANMSNAIQITLCE